MKGYVGIYAADERSKAFSPILPTFDRNTNYFIITMPGRHATPVGNAAVDGSAGINCLSAPGRVTRDLAEKFLTSWGTNLKNKLDLNDQQTLKFYDEMIEQSQLFTEMHKQSYTLFTQKGSRAVIRGDGTFSNFDTVRQLTQDPGFVNSHHRTLFAMHYPLLYEARFEPTRYQKAKSLMTRILESPRLSDQFSQLVWMYPNFCQRNFSFP